MRRFGWTRLACLFLVLTVLTALVRLGGGGAEARSLAARVPDNLVVASEQAEEPAVTRLTEEDISSLEDMRGEPRPTDSSPRWARASLPSESVPVAAQKRPAEERAKPVPTAEPPVFYRPAVPGVEAASGPVCGDLSGAPAGGRIVFPLERQFFYSYDDTWGASRTQGGHEGTDLMTPLGVPEFAITDGTVVPVAGSDAGGWNSLGGNAVMVRADYSIGPVKAGDLFYYAHLENESPLEIGDRVNAGQVVGYAGDTGQGPPGTSGLFPSHLHLGWYDGTGGRQEADSGAMDPYPLLEWIKSNGGAVSGGSDARFCEAPRPGPPAPSSGGPWPTPSNPGLDTNSDDPNPVRATPANSDDANLADKPIRPNRPTKDPNTPRPETQKPDRPNDNPRRHPRPDSGGNQQPPPKPPEKDPLKPDPAPGTPQEPGPPSQYDQATGEPEGPTATPPPKPDRGPESPRKPAADERTDGSKEPTPEKSRPNTADRRP